MLQRAASNAYSWWWASHIRTKQSKWLDNDIEEMEERVKSMLKIIEQDGDSFAKKAEMYFKERPELVSFVEEMYKAYRALAEKYDHISSELHKANHTIATAFPDQVQFNSQDEDDDNLPKAITSIDPSKLRKPSANIPQMSLMNNKRRENQPTLKKSRLAKADSEGSKEKAQEDIDRLQKGILVLQTEKEFIKSSYEEGVAKYWDIEKQINEMQEEVFLLQDGFSASVVIEDDEARAIMAATALKSCEDTLNNLQKKQKRAIKKAKKEKERIKIAKKKLIACKGEDSQSEKTDDISDDNKEADTVLRNVEEFSDQMQENLEPEPLCEDLEENVEICSDTSVVELAEKINELVSKAISLEVTTSSQTAQIKSLRKETDSLNKSLQRFEEEKKALIDESNSLRDKLKKAEELLSMQSFDECLPNENRLVDEISAEASLGSGDISKPMSPKLRTQISMPGSSQGSDTSLQNIKAAIDCNNREIEEKQMPALEKSSLEKKSMVDKDIAGTSHVPGDFSEEVMFPNQQNKSTSAGLSQENVTSVNGIETSKDSSKMEGKKKLDRKKNLVSEESQGIKEPVFHLNDQETSNHPEAGSQLKYSSVSPVLKQEDEISISQSDLSNKDEIHEACYDWLQSLAKGTESKEKTILAEYASILRNYKETKRRLSEAEKKNQDYLSATTEQIKRLESANVTKDEAIQSLQQTLRSLQSTVKENADTRLLQAEEGAIIPERHEKPRGQNEARTRRRRVSFDINFETLLDKDEQLGSHGKDTTSAIEDRFRRDIDSLLEENLEFWLRFSTSFQNIQKFQTYFEDLQAEIEKEKESKSQEGSSHSSSRKAKKPESLRIEKQLKELKTELQVWLEQNRLLQDELETRFSSLGTIQDEISGALEISLQEDGLQFAPYQAAKFQGELLNIQRENNKVSDELQAGLDHVEGLHAEIEKALSKKGKLELPEPRSNNQQNLRNIPTKNRVPLGSFLFTGKPKKKQSIFRMNPAMRKHANDLASWRPT